MTRSLPALVESFDWFLGGLGGFRLVWLDSYFRINAERQHKQQVSPTYTHTYLICLGRSVVAT